MQFLNKSAKAEHPGWNFGDGTMTSIQSPYHDFDSAGDYMVTLTASNSYGSKTVSRVVKVLDWSGIEKYEYPDLQVFPNPVKDELTVKFKHEQGKISRFLLFDAMGNTISIEPVCNGSGITVNTTELPAGIYFLTVTFGNNTRTKRMVKF